MLQIYLTKDFLNGISKNEMKSLDGGQLHESKNSHRV